MNPRWAIGYPRIEASININPARRDLEAATQIHFVDAIWRKLNRLVSACAGKSPG
jgi:hypothetical protein